MFHLTPHSTPCRLAVQVSALETTEAALNRKIEELQAEMDEEEEQNEEERLAQDRQIAELQLALAERVRMVEERDAKIGALQAAAENRSESREHTQLRQELEALQAKLATKDAEVEAARKGEAEGSDRVQSIQAAVRAAEEAGAQRLAEERKKHSKVESELTAKLEEQSKQLDGSKKRYTSLSEKFTQREDVIVELRARMDEYERGVHGLREEVQEKERFKALHESRCEEVKKLTFERNRREAMLQELTAEATWLREQCQVKPGDPKYMDLSQLQLASQIELQRISMSSNGSNPEQPF